MTRGAKRAVKRARGRRSAAPSHRPPIIRAWTSGVIADNFAGGGGASTAFELALGRSPDIAVNHDAEAIAMHAVNHPTTTHYTESVYKVDPKVACGGKPCAAAWFSPDCKHHSKAKGGKPRDQKIRGLAWIVVTWAQRVRPRVIFLENVEEWLKWGPLHKTHSAGCVDGETCRSGCHHNKPIKAREGETYRAWRRKLEKLGYVVEWKLLRACDYGAATTRRRLFLVARCDGKPIVWPAPTHAPQRRADQPADSWIVDSVPLAPYRTAAEHIDWSIPCPSIFDRKKPLAAKTEARIARGIRKFVLGAGRPFLVPVNHGGPGRKDHRVHDIDAPAPTITGQCRGSHALVSPVIVKAKTHGGGGNDAMAADEPLRTITASKRGEFAVAVPYLVHRSNGERPGQAPRIYDPQKPLGTVVAQGNKHALCTAFIAKHYGGNEGSGTSPAAPVDTITTQDHHAVVATHLIKFQGTSEQHLNASASGMDEPVPAITAQGGKLAQVAAFLVRYNGTGDAEPLDQPAGTLTTKPRFGLATVTIDGELYTIVDIGMRMLTPRELFLCQGFPPDYKINLVGPRGKKLTATAQIRMVGNSVSPPVAAAIVRANVPELVAS